MSHRLTRRLQHSRLRRAGATAVEYGLMVALIAMIIFAVSTFWAPNLLAIFNDRRQLSSEARTRRSLRPSTHHVSAVCHRFVLHPSRHRGG